APPATAANRGGQRESSSTRRKPASRGIATPPSASSGSDRKPSRLSQRGRNAGLRTSAESEGKRRAKPVRVSARASAGEAFADGTAGETCRSCATIVARAAVVAVTRRERTK